MPCRTIFNKPFIKDLLLFETMGYDFELERVIEKIRAENTKVVCIQLADGLKPMAGEIHDKLKAATGCRVLIWADSCFGACDVPLGLEALNVDLLVHFGHSEWK